jgi:hypothetical protein
MSERPKSPSLVVPLLIAVTVLGLGFGGGVFGGWATRRRTPKPPERSAASIPDAEVKRELAACKRELKALKKARAKPLGTAMLGEMDAGLEKAAKVEALQKEVEQCKVRETLQNGYVCGTIGKQINLYDVLAHGMSCVDPPGIGEYLLSSVDKCAQFDDFPAHLDKDELTKSELARIYESKINHHAESKENLVKGMQWMRRECRRIWALPNE